MKLAWWKKWLSYLFEITIDEGSTSLNPYLHLGLHKGRFRLSTPNAIYSYGDLYDNFSRSFQQINIQDIEVQEVLVLGFGLGSIPYMLEKTFHKKCSFTGVEADEMIAYWASQYVTPELDSPIHMSLTDALVFVDVCEQQFDLIAMDIFIDNKVPGEFETEEFLESLKGLLSPDGILMYNRLAFQDWSIKQTEKFYENTFKKVFPQASHIKLSGNWMLLNQTLKSTSDS